MRLVMLIGVAIVVALNAQCLAQAQDLRAQIEDIVKDYLSSHPDEVGQIAKDYFVKHPEAVGQILAELLKHRVTSPGGTGSVPPSNDKPAADHGAAVASNAKLLFDSPHQVTLGNPHGKVTLVEFFDYNCGFCKRALPDMLALLKSDADLKLVLKEFPILGPGSVDAARIAIAVRMQDESGDKYLAFHNELLGNPGPASKEKALAAAKDQGIDMLRVEKDMSSGEVEQTLTENMKLASALGISGTPSYVIGKDVVVGAIGLVALQQHIRAAERSLEK